MTFGVVLGLEPKKRGQELSVGRAKLASDFRDND